MGYLTKETKNFKKKRNEWEKNQPGDYSSRWQGTLDDTLNKILNREQFSYDFNADPMYQMYKDQYVNMGKQAMADTVGNVASLTGGYGNSYAATAGSQAYQEYLKGLNSIIPELQQNALAKYQMDTENLYNAYSAVGQQEDREYGQFSDNWNRWYNMLGYYADQYNTGANRDQNQWQFKKNLSWDKNKFGQELAFKREQLAQDQAQWAAEFGLKQQQFAQSLTSENASGGSQGSSSSGSGRRSSGRKGKGSSGVTTQTVSEQPMYDDRGFRLNYKAVPTSKGMTTEEARAEHIAEKNGINADKDITDSIEILKYLLASGQISAVDYESRLKALAGKYL